MTKAKKVPSKFAMMVDIEKARCPLCKSSDYRYTAPYIRSMKVSQIGTCNDCNAEWRIIYTMTDVELMGEE